MSRIHPLADGLFKFVQAPYSPVKFLTGRGQGNTPKTMLEVVLGGRRFAFSDMGPDAYPYKANFKSFIFRL